MIITNDCIIANANLKGAKTQLDNPLPRNPLIDTHSISKPARGITSASNPFRVPIHITSTP